MLMVRALLISLLLTLVRIPSLYALSAREGTGVSGGDSLLVMFWNLENFFDFIDQSHEGSDLEFSSLGSRHWTKARFYAKCNAVAKSILWIGERYGQPPDVIGVGEVENSFVLSRLIHATALYKLDYSYVHFDSPDRRGIDVGLLYRRSRLRLLDARPCRVDGFKVGKDADTSYLHTRDILLARFQTRGGNASPRSSEGNGVGEGFTVLVNHHPSKFGGGESDWRREVAVRRLEGLRDSLVAVGEEHIIAMGDFNDVPENAVLRRLFESNAKPLSERSPYWAAKKFGVSSTEKARFVNLAVPLSRKGEGTIRYNGRWELIDMFFVTSALAEKASMSVVRIPFLITRDSVHSGEKPLRTYVGPRYTAGVSDHLPIMLKIEDFGAK